MRRHNASEMDCTLCRRLRGSLQSGVHDLRVVTRSYSLSQLSLLKTHETLVPSVGRFQSQDVRCLPILVEPPYAEPHVRMSYSFGGL